MSSDRRRLYLTFSLLVSLAMWIAATVSVAQAPDSAEDLGRCGARGLGGANCGASNSSRTLQTR